MRSPANRRLAYDAVFLALSLILSYLESVFSGFLPIPGLKLGLPNVAVMAVFSLFGKKDALIVSLLRCFVQFLLFGSAPALLLSLSGAFFSFFLLLLTDCGRRRGIGVIGASVLSAAAHITGQCAAASLFYGFLPVLFYYPTMLALSAPCGIVTGVLLVLILRAAERIPRGRERA